MIYIYAIAEKGGALPEDMTGIEDAQPALLECRDIAAVVSTVSARHISPDAAKVWQHESVVERLMADRAVLPVRYGTVLGSEQEMRDILAANYAALAANLEQVRGQVELSLRVLSDDGGPDGGPASVAEAVTAPRVEQNGRAYMLELLQEDRERRAWRQRGQAQVDRIDAALAGLATQHTQKTFVTPHLLLTAAYLVERGRTGEFLRAVEALAQGGATTQFLCTGPWPPYNFVDFKDEIL